MGAWNPVFGVLINNVSQYAGKKRKTIQGNVGHQAGGFGF